MEHNIDGTVMYVLEIPAVQSQYSNPNADLCRDKRQRWHSELLVTRPHSQETSEAPHDLLPIGHGALQSAIRRIDTCAHNRSVVRKSRWV